MSFALVAAWFLGPKLQAWSGTDVRALEMRAERLSRLAVRGDGLFACLDGPQPQAVEAHCTDLMFSAPETLARAVNFTGTRLALLADASRLGTRKADEPGWLVSLRRSLERDTTGIVAHVLGTRHGCSAERCPSLTLFNDTVRLRENLRTRPFDVAAERQARTWPNSATGAISLAGSGDRSRDAGNLGPAAGTDRIPEAKQERGKLASSPHGREGGDIAQDRAPEARRGVLARGAPIPDRYSLPSADSIPPINIMGEEPSADPKNPADSKGKKSEPGQQNGPAAKR